MSPAPDASRAPEPGGIGSVAAEPAADGDIAARRSSAQVVKDIALFFAAPFVTLAYLSLFPFIAISMLRQARRQRKAPG